MDKPHGTLICPNCGSIQCGTLDLICDKCKEPVFLVKEIFQIRPADPVDYGPVEDEYTNLDT